MLKDVTLGQYYQADSVIHRLDPRVKLVGTLAYMISLFVFNNIFCYAVAIVLLAVVIALSKVPVGYMLKGMRAVLFIMVFTVVFNVFFTSGTNLVEFWIFHISKEGVRMAIFMVIRLTLLIISASIMTLTTTPNRLTDGLEKLFRPLKIFKLPVHEIAMMMSIALRFIPILMEEADKIMKAQTARGAKFDSKKFTERAKSLIPLIVPLFISAFRRASDLALAMEARGYHGGDGRTKLYPLKYASRDIISYVILILYIAVIVFLGIMSARIIAHLTPDNTYLSFFF
ncbi:MAG: energy-coupling factor transporter transmembrane protein EcfT [Lachnospiraceae bacterium]|nr:energy-coupling factor transporter transmembrane protein EcfT [Lachnospiraceae bacterium]